MTTETQTMTAGAALLSRFSTLGVDYIFANSGTDFPPVIEGLSEAEARGIPLPRTVTVPFESAAIGMAHGYTLATGRPQAVMVHTNVGLANAAMGAINAACDNIPMLLFSGRTPTLEKGRFGARTVPIGWGQEMLDQASLIREACKWDYELRFAEQVFDVIDRAHGIASSTPKGPVYVSLPREVLSETIPSAGAARRHQMRGAEIRVDASQMAEIARLLAEAENPVIFAQHGAGSPEAFAALARLAESWGNSGLSVLGRRTGAADDASDGHRPRSHVLAGTGGCHPVSGRACPMVARNSRAARCCDRDPDWSAPLAGPIRGAQFPLRHRRDQ